MRQRLLFLILAFLLAACGGQLATGGVSGTWLGTFTSTNAPLTLELTQNGASLRATLTVGESSVAMTGTAVASPTDTLVSLSSQGMNPVRIEASVDGNTMRGVLAVEAEEINSGAFTATR